MGKPVEMVKHKGKKICYSDYSELEGEEFVNAIYSNHEQIRRWRADGEKDFLFLSNVTDTFANRDITRAFKEIAKANLPITHKSAAVGVTGVQKMLLASINLFSALPTQPFNTVEEAMDWLVE